ncbi:MAG: hypothetical protein KJO87_07760, partial [Acidimicrobiia bacterium]|nr:hypothetical protein [Acidimicrobiia bacterium]
RYLEANGEWSPAWQDELEQAAAADVDAAITAAEQLEPLGAAAVFDAVFAEPTPQLLRQRNRAATDE